MGLAPEDRKSQALLLEWDLTKNVTLPDVARFQRGLIRVRAERDAAETQLKALHTTPSDGSRRARQLSGGNQQKVVLARWLLKRVQGAPARRADARRRRRAPRRSCSASSPTWPARASA